MSCLFIKTSIVGLSIFSIGLQSRADGAAAAATAASSVAMIAAVSSVGTAAALRVPCTAGANPLACVMMGLAVVQVGLALGTKSKSDTSAANLTSGTSGTDTSTATDPSATYTTADGITGTTATTAAALVANGLGGIAADYVSAAQAVKSSGVTVSADGSSATLPNGKSVSSSSLGSTQAMKDAGFSNSDISGTENALAGASKMIAAEMKKVGSLTNDVAGGGGGAGSAGAGAGGGGGYGNGADAFSKMMKNVNGKKGGAGDLAGMSKKLGNDNIGVAGDDIFEMVTRRYQARDKADNFLKK